MWKSARPKRRYVRNRNVVEKITKKAFAEKDEIKKTELLCELDGVGIPIASALLTIPYPGKYAIIDIRCLEILKRILNFKIGKSASMNTWLKYLEIMRRLAKENNVTPREMDMAFFAMHREMLENKSYKNLYDKKINDRQKGREW